MRRALVVDDSAVMRRVITKMLEDIGFTCEAAGDGAAALAMLLDDRGFDLVCSDLHMPVMNGIELVRELRSRVELEGLPVLIVSSDSDRKSIARALLAGADEYATKPLTTAFS